MTDIKRDELDSMIEDLKEIGYSLLNPNVLQTLQECVDALEDVSEENTDEEILTVIKSVKTAIERSTGPGHVLSDVLDSRLVCATWPLRKELGE